MLFSQHFIHLPCHLVTIMVQAIHLRCHPFTISVSHVIHSPSRVSHHVIQVPSHPVTPRWQDQRSSARRCSSSCWRPQWRGAPAPRGRSDGATSASSTTTRAGGRSGCTATCGGRPCRAGPPTTGPLTSPCMASWRWHWQTLLYLGITLEKPSEICTLECPKITSFKGHVTLKICVGAYITLHNHTRLLAP